MITWRHGYPPCQIRFAVRPGRGKATAMVVLTCNCLGPSQMIAERERWDDPAEFFALWRAHRDRLVPR